MPAKALRAPFANHRLNGLEVGHAVSLVDDGHLADGVGHGWKILDFQRERREDEAGPPTLVLSIDGALYPFQWFDIFSALIIFALLWLIFLLSLSDPAFESDDEP